MASIYSTPSDYWIKPGALTISLNALDNPQYTQASVLSGAVIMAFKPGVIEYDSSHNYRKWKLTAENTFFKNSDAKYVYARLDRKEEATQALIVYSNEKLDIVGRTETKEDVEDHIEEDLLHFYIYLGSITISVNNDGDSIPRVWDDPFNFGTLATDQYIKEESKTAFEKMFRLNEITGMIEVLKTISEATINIANIGKKLFFGKKEITDLKRSIDSDKDVPVGDNNLTTSKYVEEDISRRAISKVHDDRTAGHLTLVQGATSEGLLQANGGLVVRKEELVEASFLSLTEEGEDSLIEEIDIGGDTPGATTTIGGLTNVNDNADAPSETDDLLVRLAGSAEWSVNSNLFTHVSQLMTKVFPFTMSLSGGGTYEKGSSQTVNLSWTYDRDIESQSINNESLAIGIRSKQYTNVTVDKTYTLRSVCNGENYSKSVSVQFKTMKYYGVSDSSSLTNGQILALSCSWSQRAQGSTVFDCTGGKYPYYILPTSLVTGIQFWIGGLRNTDWIEEIREVTNAYGYTESYTIFRLNSIQTGALNIEVK